MMSSWKELVRSWLKPSPQRGRTRQVRRLGLEALEVRDTPSITVSGSSATWTPVGPTGIANETNLALGSDAQDIAEGAVNGVAVDPFNSAHVVIGAVNGGIWTTNNIYAQNVSWTTGSDSLPSLAISEVEFSPVTQGVVYAATGSYSNGGLGVNDAAGVTTTGDGGPAVGIYESTDGGLTWPTQLGAMTFAGLRINAFVPTTLDGGKILFASTADNSAALPTDPSTTGLYESTDSGKDWVQVSGATNSGLPLLPVTSVIADPGDPNRFYADVIGAGGGVFMLDTTISNTWVNISNNLPSGVISGADRVVLASSAFGVDPVYAAVVGAVAYGAGEGLLGVYRAVPFTSPGQPTEYVWTAIGPGGLPPDILPGGQGSTNLGLVADPKSDSIVYIAGDRLLTPSQTSGFSGAMARGDAIADTWTTVTLLPNPVPAPDPGTVNPLDPGPQPTTAPHADFRDLVFDGSSTILAVSDGGIYQLTDPQGTTAAPTWSSLNGNLQTTEFYTTGIDDKGSSNPSSSELVGASQDNSAEDAVNQKWGAVTSGDGTIAEADNTNHYEYFSAQYLEEFTREDPDGQLVAPAATINGTGLSLDGNSTFLPSFAFNQANENSFMINGPGGTTSLLYTTDNGNTFTSIGGIAGGFPANVPNVGSSTATQITAEAFGTSQIRNAAYVATDDGNISQSFDITTNNGNFTYTDFQSVADGVPATAIAMDPNNPLLAYAVANNGVYMTTNGQHWVSITGNLNGLVAAGGETKLYSIVLFTDNQTNASNDYLLVGGYGGVYKLSIANVLAGSDGWVKLGAGLPNVVVSSLTYDSLTDSLLAGTFGRGAFRLLNVTSALTSTPVVVDVVGGVGPNSVAVYPDTSNPADYIVTDGLGNMEMFATNVYPVVSLSLSGGATTGYVGTSGPGMAGTTTGLGVQVIASGLGASADTLVIDDSADTTGEQVTLTPDSGSAPGEIGLGTGDTLFAVGGSIQFSGFDAGLIQFNFGSGSNTLDIDDATTSAGTSNTTATTYTVTSTGVTRSSGGQYAFNGLVNLNLSGSNGADAFDVDSTAGTTSVTGGIVNTTFNITSAALGGPLTVNGGGGTDTLIVTGTGQDDAVTAQLTDPTGGGNFTGLTQPLNFTQIQNASFNALGGSTSFTFEDSTGVASGTPTDLSAGMVFTPATATSGSVAVGTEFDLSLDAITDGVTLDGDGTGAGTLDTLLVLGISAPGLSTLGEPVIGNGQDQITVSDTQVSITSDSAGALLSPSLAPESGTSNPTFSTLYVATGGASGSLGDQVTVTPSVNLNLVVDASGGTSTAGNSVIVSGVGPFTDAQTSDPMYGPTQTRITDVGTAGEVGLIGFTTTSFQGPGLPSGVQSSGMIAVGTQAGPQAEVQVYDRLTGDLRFTIIPFPGFDGGLSIAVGDVTGNGISDLVVGAGAGGGPLVAIYDGLDGQPIGSFYAYSSAFRGGVNVSVADTNNSGHANIVTGVGPGGGPNVRVFDGQTYDMLQSAFVYDSTFRGGVSVAVGDVTQAGVPDLVTSTGAGGGPRILVLNASNLTQIGSFYAFNSTSRSGFSVAVADVIGDGLADIIVGSGPGIPNEIKVFTGPTEGLYTDFYPNDPFNASAGPNAADDTGVQVSAADVNGDGIADILAVGGSGSAPVLDAFQVSSVIPPNNVLVPVLKEIRSQVLFNNAINTGLVVAGGD